MGPSMNQLGSQFGDNINASLKVGKVFLQKSPWKTNFRPNVKHFEFPQNALGLLNHGMNDKIQLHNQNNNLPDLRFAKSYS